MRDFDPPYGFFKMTFCKFESYMPSQPVQSPRCDFRVCENRRHSGGLGWCARVSVPQFPHFRSRTGGFRRQSLLAIFQFPFRRAGDRFDM